MGFWTDWLDPNHNDKIEGRYEDGRSAKRTGPDGDMGGPRSKWDTLAGVKQPRATWCDMCDRTSGHCRCDKKLGRPRRWWE